jgi:hypothetical protein
MKHYATSVYVLFFMSTALQFLSCLTVVLRGYTRSWKAFSYYLFCVTASSVAGLVAVFVSKEIYQYVYTGASLLEAVTLSLVVFEIMVKMLEPFEALPGRLVARFGFWAAVGISSAITLSVLVGHNALSQGVDPALAVERTVYLAAATLLWLLIFQARSLGVTWQSSVAEIAIAFVLYLTVQAAVRFVVMIYWTNAHVVDIANLLGQFAYMVSLCSWIWTMRHRDPDTVFILPEKVAEVHALASKHDGVPKEKIFAAVGIKIHKIEAEEQPMADAPEAEKSTKVVLN